MLTDKQIEILVNQLDSISDRSADESSGGWYLIKRLDNGDININLFAVSKMINIEP